jgi:hypothetical protein
LDENKIPEIYRKHVLDKINKLVDDFQAATPNATIEMARDAAAAVMNAVVLEKKLIDSPKDLSDSAKLYSKYCEATKNAGHYNIVHCAKILANLHDQNKSAQQLKKGHRPLEESDAETAVKCLGHIFRDLQWARS